MARRVSCMCCWMPPNHAARSMRRRRSWSHCSHSRAMPGAAGCPHSTHALIAPPLPLQAHQTATAGAPPPGLLLAAHKLLHRLLRLSSCSLPAPPAPGLRAHARARTRSSARSPLARAPPPPPAWHHRPSRRATPARPPATRRPPDSSAVPGDICAPSSCAPLPSARSLPALLGQLRQSIRPQYSADLFHLVRLRLAVLERLQVNHFAHARSPQRGPVAADALIQAQPPEQPAQLREPHVLTRA